jgi:hypothetical protein
MQNQTVETVAASGGDAEHYANFLDAIRNQRRSVADIEGAHQSTLLCHLGNIAQRTGRQLQIDPSNGHILGDAEAQQLWGREAYRDGFNPQAYI